MKILISHPSGNANTRNLINALDKNNILDVFITKFNFNTNNKIYKLLPNFILNILKRRNFSKLTNKIITTNILKEFFNFFFITNKFKSGHLKNHFDIDIFTAKYLKKNLKNIDSVYCYEDAALETFKVAKHNNIRCVYELTSCHWRLRNKIIKNESQKYKKFKFKNNYIDKKLQIRKDQELEFADLIIVPSKFLKNSLKNSKFYKKKIFIVPYGFNKISIKLKPKKIISPKLLFVGALEPGKGIIYLIKAYDKIVRNYNNAKLTIVGKGILKSYLLKFSKKFKNLNIIDYLPHKKLFNLMRDSDFFIFPSLSEGYGLVLSEAMSNGLITLSTKETAYPEMINYNKHLLLKPKNYNNIYNKIIFLMQNQQLINRYRKLNFLMSKKYNWNDYQSKIISILKKQ